MLASGLLVLGFACLAGAQYAIRLENPSFESRKPRPARLPAGWHTCSAPGVSPPDLHPSGVFKVKMKPYDGKSHVGIVARPDGTRENVAQYLPEALDAGQCYAFSLYAARSPHYLSFSPVTGAPLDFNTPLCIEIRGSSGYCTPGELLARSTVVDAHSWQKLDFLLKPSAPCRYLRIEAAFAQPEGPAYPGHVLLDACSAIVPAACGNE